MCNRVIRGLKLLFAATLCLKKGRVEIINFTIITVVEMATGMQLIEYHSKKSNNAMQCYRPLAFNARQSTISPRHLRVQLIGSCCFFSRNEMKENHLTSGKVAG